MNNQTEELLLIAEKEYDPNVNYTELYLELLEKQSGVCQ